MRIEGSEVHAAESLSTLLKRCALFRQDHPLVVQEDYARCLHAKKHQMLPCCLRVFGLKSGRYLHIQPYSLSFSSLLSRFKMVPGESCLEDFVIIHKIGIFCLEFCLLRLSEWKCHLSTQSTRGLNILTISNRLSVKNPDCTLPLYHGNVPRSPGLTRWELESEGPVGRGLEI